jgi:hypothetical protein
MCVACHDLEPRRKRMHLVVAAEVEVELRLRRPDFAGSDVERRDPIRGLVGGRLARRVGGAEAREVSELRVRAALDAFVPSTTADSDGVAWQEVCRRAARLRRRRRRAAVSLAAALSPPPSAPWRRRAKSACSCRTAKPRTSSREPRSRRRPANATEHSRSRSSAQCWRWGTEFVSSGGGPPQATPSAPAGSSTSAATAVKPRCLCGRSEPFAPGARRIRPGSSRSRKRRSRHSCAGRPQSP